MLSSEQVPVRNLRPASTFPVMAQVKLSRRGHHEMSKFTGDELIRTCHRRGACIECLQPTPRSAGMRTELLTFTRAARLFGAKFGKNSPYMDE